AEELGAVELLAPAVLLDDVDRHRLDPLVGREALAAVQALAPAPDGLAGLRVARVDDLAVAVLAVRAPHRAGTLAAAMGCLAVRSPGVPAVAQEGGDVEVVGVVGRVAGER